MATPWQWLCSLFIFLMLLHCYVRITHMALAYRFHTNALDDNYVVLCFLCLCFCMLAVSAPFSIRLFPFTHFEMMPLNFHLKWNVRLKEHNNRTRTNFTKLIPNKVGEMSLFGCCSCFAVDKQRMTALCMLARRRWLEMHITQGSGDCRVGTF